VTYWSWRGIFLVNIPIGIILVVLGVIFIPDIARRPDRHLDVRGVVLLGATLLAAMLGIGYLGGGRSITKNNYFLAPECVEVACATAFVRSETQRLQWYPQHVVALGRDDRHVRGHPRLEQHLGIRDLYHQRRKSPRSAP
jgi:hypothetical protein